MKNQSSNRRNLFIGLAAFALAALAFAPLYAQDGGRPELFTAESRDDLVAVKALINAGADVNALYDEDTVLCEALMDDHLEIAKAIIQAPKFNPNLRSRYVDDTQQWERTPLILASRNGQTEIVRLLLQKGADINARDSIWDAPLSIGMTALMYTASQDRLDTAKVLLAHTTKPNIQFQDGRGWTAFWYAVGSDDFEMVKLFFANGSKIAMPDADGSSVLVNTIFNEKYDILDWLVANGADINMVNNNGSTPLMTAVSSRGGKTARQVYNYIVKFLTLKPKINFMAPAGDAALHIAAGNNDSEVVNLLLDNGATIDILSLGSGRTPLHTAAIQNNVDVVRLLMRRGAQKDIQDKTGQTPLLAACILAHVQTAQALIDAGAQLNVRSNVNIFQTPLCLFAMNVDPAKHSNGMTIMKYLLDKNADVNFASGNGSTPLMLASGGSNFGQGLEKATLLVSRGAKLDLVNEKGETALMLAAGIGNDKIVKLLLDKGANWNLKNGAGEAAMAYTARSGKPAVTALFTAKGAKAEAPVALPMVVNADLVGTWTGFQDGLPQALYTIVMNRDGTFDFNSAFTKEALAAFPAGSINPIIAAQKGKYTFNGDTMIWNITGVAAPSSMKWKLENGLWIIDNKIRLKKSK